MLVGRTFSYSDTQRHRIGPNYLQVPVNKPKVPVATNQRGGQMSYGVDLAPGQNPHINFEPSIHDGLKESDRPDPNYPPTISGQLTRAVIERRNDYAQARGRFNTMMDWERDDLIHNMGDLLSQCQRDVQERMLWHFFLIHDDYGNRVGKALGLAAQDVSHLAPLPEQLLTEEDKQRLRNLGNNGDKIDPGVWGQWTSSVTNHQATAEEVLSGNINATPAPMPAQV
jgi:catalase